MLKNLKEFKLPEIEEKVLELWRQNHIFERLLSNNKKNKTFRFYEGPPYANGRPAIHHVLSRVFKDIILRYKSMSGYYVPRRAGWDTHGLPIELAVEKALGIKNKSEIDKFGIALFNGKAREMIWQYLDLWEKFTERIGVWYDLKNAYVTCTNDYIESLWWIFNKIHKRGYLNESRKIVPYCPRCQTPLSSHELGQPGVYKLTADPSVYVKFLIKENKKSGKSKNKKADKIKSYLLVWTTTPWTLPANVAVAVNTSLTYTKYKVGNEYLWSYNAPPKLPENAEVAEKISGKKLVGLEYKPFYKNSKYKIRNTKYCRVVAADFVSTEDGTGLVHIAPAFGEDDFNLLSKVDFPVTIDNEGKMLPGFPGAGKFIKQADKDIIEDLMKRNLVYLETKVEHEYPFCWRCSAPLIYFARKSWFLEVSRLRKKLLSENAKINWIPDYIKDGRFGEWLKDAKDWAISRDRYWGTPLPIWRCEKCTEIKVVGSLEELSESAYYNNKFIILRHGEATANVEELIAAGPEKGNHISKLTEAGKKRAVAVAKELKKKKIDIIYASPYLRTKDTAKIVAKETKSKIIIDDRLKEINDGIFNWGKIEEQKKFFESPIEEFTKIPPSGENLNQVKNRVFEFIREVNVKYQNKTILIVSHGDPLWVLEAAAKNLSNEENLKLSYINTGEWREIKLSNMPCNEKAEIDVHRPYVDDVYLKCEKCKGRMKRVRDVADVWFDSGAMPLASVHYPFENRKFIEKESGYPADFIAEGIDQTRGWFYTLLATAVLLGKEAPYRNVISLGLLRDKFGQKMSKSKGNVVEPMEIIQKYGIDTVRWYFYTINPPAEPKNFDEADLGKVIRRFFLTIYNSYVFYGTVEGKKMASEEHHVMDRWILSRLHETIEEATKKLNSYEIGEAARLIELLVDDLSRWYIRRSRRRPEMKETLGFVLWELSKMIAPFAPFLGEALHQSLKDEEKHFRENAGKCSSVHLEDWPKAEKRAIDKELTELMQYVRQIAAVVLAKRSEVGIKVRQPLLSVKIKTKDERFKKNKELLDVLKEEINVKEISFDDSMVNEIELDINITPELREEGMAREFTRLIQDLRKEANLKPKDNMMIFIEGHADLEKMLVNNLTTLKNDVNASSIEFKRTDKFDIELISGKIDSYVFWVGLRKI